MTKVHHKKWIRPPRKLSDFSLNHVRELEDKADRDEYLTSGEVDYMVEYHLSKIRHDCPKSKIWWTDPLVRDIEDHYRKKIPLELPKWGLGRA
jgi:hypothetical protein